MNQTDASERRLSAALDRIDRAVDAVARRSASAPEPASAPTPDPALAAAEAARDAALAEAVRLAEANERLIAANRALTEAPSDPDVRVEALQAELAALQAVRSAEVARMDEILTALETLAPED